MMRRRPQNTWCVHQVAVVLYVYRETSIFPVGQCSTNGGRRPIPNAGAAGAADKLMVLVEGPESRGPVALRGRHQRPVFGPDLRPDLSEQPGRADGTGIPCVRRVDARLLERGSMSRGELLSAVLQSIPAIRRQQTFDGFDQSRKRRFRVGSHGDVDFGISFEV